MKREKGRRGTQISSVQAQLFNGFTILVVGLTTATIILFISIDPELKPGEYGDVKASTESFTIVFKSLGFLIASLLIFTVISLILEKKGKPGDSDMRMGAVYIAMSAFVILLPTAAVFYGHVSSTVYEHNDAVTVQKLETVYESVHRLKGDENVLNTIPDSSRVDYADPYLVEKNGEEYVLYTTVDTEKNSVDVMTETKSDTKKPVKSIK